MTTVLQGNIQVAVVKQAAIYVQVTIHYFFYLIIITIISQLVVILKEVLSLVHFVFLGNIVITQAYQAVALAQKASIAMLVPLVVAVVQVIIIVIIIIVNHYYN